MNCQQKLLNMVNILHLHLKNEPFEYKWYDLTPEDIEKRKACRDNCRSKCGKGLVCFDDCIFRC